MKLERCEVRRLADSTVELGALALLLGRRDRSSLHPDGVTYESVTDHTVMVSMVACALAARLYPADLYVGVVAEFATVHDLVEAYAHDTPTLRLPTSEQKADKVRREREAFKRIAEEFGETFGWLVERLRQYEEQDIPEARWVRAVDNAVVKTTHLLNGCAAPRAIGMHVAELSERYAIQYRELFGPGGYAADFPRLGQVYQELVGLEIATLAAVLDG